MTGRCCLKRTGFCLLALLLAGLFSDDVLVAGEPEPIPSELLYTDSLIKTAENLVSIYRLWRLIGSFPRLTAVCLSQILLNKLKQVIEEKKDMAEREKVLDDVEMEIQSALEDRAKAKARLPSIDYSAEELPTPNAVVSQAKRSGKRNPISCECRLSLSLSLLSGLDRYSTLSL